MQDNAVATTIAAMEPIEPVLALVRDLMFSSKIIATARALQIDIKIIRDAEKLNLEKGSKLFVDLGEPHAIASAMTWKQLHGGKVIGFVSHVDTNTIFKAQEAGFDQVLSKGGFTANLENLLKD